MKTNTETQNASELSPILHRVASILNMNDEDIFSLQKLELEKGLRRTIEEIVSENKDNKELIKMLLKEYKGNIFSVIKQDFKKDKDIAILAVRNSSENFYSLDRKLQKDLDVLKELVKSFVREGISFLDFENFVENFCKDSPKIKKTLYDFYLKQLDISSSVFGQEDLSKILPYIKQQNENFYNALKREKIVISKGKKTIINIAFVQKLLGQLQKENSIFETKQQKEAFVIELIGNILGIDINLLDEDSRSIIDNILIVLSNLENKQSINQKQEAEKETDSEDASDKDIKDFGEEDEDDFENILDFCVPNCSYTYEAGTYELTTPENRKIKLSEQEQKNFNSKALQNFVVFYNTLYDLGLNFLWDKYKTDFTTILNNKIGFNYMYGSGLRESRILSTLNLIGKNIGVPEKEVLAGSSTDDEKNTKWVCFKTLGGAKLAFKDIKETGKINGETYSDLGTFSRGAVENKLIAEGKIDIEKGVLNVSEW